MQRTVLLFLLLTGIIALNACAGLRLDNSEPPAAADATPPPGYAPIYLKHIASIATKQPTKPAVIITRIEATQPNAIRAYIHLLDSNGTYFSGASTGKPKAWWCEVIDEINGVKQPLKKYTLREITEDERQPYAIALVMDHSGSMGDARALAVQNAADDFINKKKAEDAIALVKYDNTIGVEAPLMTDASILHSRLQKTALQGYGKFTAILNGIQAGMEQLATVGTTQRKAVIVFTDGQDNSSTIPKDSVIMMARKTNTLICAIDFGNGVNESFLREIAQATGGSYHHMYGTSEFNDVFEDVYRRLRNYYVLEFTPYEYGVHTLSLKLCFPQDSVRTVATYDNTPDIGTTALLDVNFDTDKSTIKPLSLSAIDNVYALMKTHPRITIELRGHTDASNRTGDPDYNLKLSQRRADAVKENLVKRGIAQERVTAIGFGDTKPIADNATNEGKAQNRRTEFLIVSK